VAGLRLVSPESLIASEDQAAREQVAAEQLANDNARLNNSLAAFIENRFGVFTRHRDSSQGWSDRLVEAMRVFSGKYDPTKLAEIKKFGGSEIYARVTATKCRGATSLLRDIYLNQEKPWALKPTPDPTLPDNVLDDVKQLVDLEVQNATQGGVQPPPNQDQIADRSKGLIASAMRAAVKTARMEAEQAFKKLDDLLVEGGFYEAIGELLIDISLFPFCVLKGPIVRIEPQVTWVEGRAQLVDKPKMFWNRVSPFDVWWTPGVSNIKDAEVIERTRITRAELNQLLGLPGYDEVAIREVLQWYGQSGYVEALASHSDTSRALAESREDPRLNQSGMIDMIEYHGYVQGRMLLDYGMSPSQVPDELKDYFVDVFKIGRYIIKVQLNPSLRKRPPYYVTSFEKVPGTVVGNALPDVLVDIQDAANAALRALINNMSIASGPQVIINDDRVAENENSDELYPWKRWHTNNDPMGNTGQKVVDFYQPGSNAQELLGVYEKFTQIADELSAIPRYITGSERLGGAGRTASGLAMLMGNAAKILQTVAANIDGDVIKPAVSELYDLIMLTDTTGMLRGDESIDVLGVAVAMQRETQRQRSLEFLQITANPIDTQIMGIRGRANVLRAVADGIGMEGETIVPPDEEIRAMQTGPPPGGPPGGPPGAAPQGGPPGAPPGQPQQQGAAAPQAPNTNVVGKTAGSGAGARQQSVNPGQGPA